MSTGTTDTAREDLAAAAGADNLREATDRDLVGDVRPRWIAHVDGTERAAAVMRAAAAHQLTVVPRGTGTKTTWANPPQSADLVLDMSRANAVLEHAAGDLVLRAQAGTPISEIQRVVRAAGQQLAIDQPLPGATVGGVIAANTSGPGRHLFGGVRDLLIGITVVRADGTTTTAGGKVVKNVAGYDLGKIYTGSCGTLGVITEAIFRLHPLAEDHRWITLTAPDATTADRAATLIRTSQQMPTAIELDRPVADGPITVSAQLEGRASVTENRARELAEHIAQHTGTTPETTGEAPGWWGQYPFDPVAGTGLRLGCAPARLSTMLEGAQRAAQKTGVPLALRGAAGWAVLHASLPADTDAATAAELVTALRGSADYVALVCGPQEVRAAVDPSGAIDSGALTLMRRVKDQFDPEHRLAPGRFVGGI
jgi:glycolate oxidase FAD binding subunit